MAFSSGIAMAGFLMEKQRLAKPQNIPERWKYPRCQRQYCGASPTIGQDRLPGRGQSIERAFEGFEVRYFHYGLILQI